ncbi:metallopeptidase family protein [Streptomyces sp. Vc74B-19]|nr:metallopeptidase family protein [Streptomyces sp. Vc74B-19]
MDSPVTPHPAGPGPRRRDRHGRGMRGPIAPPQVPLAASRAETFADLVQDSVERLERRWPQLADIDFLVLDVPRLDGAAGAGWSDETVPLGGTVTAREGRPARVVIYRRPVEIRSKGRDERAALVHEVVVEQVADLLGLTPETVDPRYGED